VTWPAVFDGIGALVVSCALDPDDLARKIPRLTWIAFKVGGTDVAADVETQHCYNRWKALGLKVGAWVYCTGPPEADHAAIFDVYHGAARFGPLDCAIYDVEVAYKSDEGGHYEYAAELVATHGGSKFPTAVTSYGGYKTSIDFASFDRAGWPIFAQVYDAFVEGDEQTYRAAYPAAGIHRLTRRLHLAPSEAVYRPESIDA